MDLQYFNVTFSLSGLNALGKIYKLLLKSLTDQSHLLVTNIKCLQV